MDLTERDLVVMRAMAQVQLCTTLDDIAWRVGYRPARSGRLAILKTLRRILASHGEHNVSIYGESSRYVGRLPPRDQWDTEKWFLTSEAKTLVNQQFTENGK